MDFFASTEAVEQLQADLASAPEELRLPLKLALAWQLRQRDCVRALALANEIACSSAHARVAPATQKAWQARIRLVQAEVKYLFGELDASQLLSDTALQEFSAQNDAIGCADAHCLLATLAGLQGDSARAQRELEAMAAACAPFDPVRLAMAEAMLALKLAFIDPASARERWAGHFAILCSAEPPLPPAALCWIEDLFGILALQDSDYVTAIKHISQAYTLALASGQIRRAALAATNVGDTFNQLGDCATALEWMQRGLALLREKGWPNMIGLALTQTAETMRRLQHYDSARQLLCEALELMASAPLSRNHTIALRYLADVELARQQYDSALAKFELVEQRALALGNCDQYVLGKRGQAETLLAMGQPQAALEAAEAALANKQAHATIRIAALRVMAAIHARHNLPAPANLSAASATSATMYYLQEALCLAQNIADSIVPADLLAALAQEHARLGDYRRAWELNREAVLAHQKTHSREADNRANAMQVAYATEKAQAKAKLARQLASFEARRAEVLQQTNATLAQLGSIGQEITACLQAELVFQVLNRHVPQLLEADSFAVFLCDADGAGFQLAFGIGQGQPLSPGDDRITALHLEVKRCVQGCCEILQSHVAASRMFAPLCLGAQVLGAIVVERVSPEGYGEREQLILRSLCAYTSIALGNAASHRQLAENRQQMMLQEKMAALGTLSSGIAHEIDNPTNFVHLAAQNQLADIAGFQDYVTGLTGMEDVPEIAQGFNQRFARLNTDVAIMLDGTGRIKHIVRDLSSFTRQGQAEIKTVRLSSCLNLTLNLIRIGWLEKVDFITDFGVDPEIECWPALLNQAFMNLMLNGCQAIEEKSRLQANTAPARTSAPHGKLWLRLLAQDGMVVVEIEDDGIGIEARHQARIMEPFYTTREVGKGTGLGLAIAFGIVEQHGGQLRFCSTPGLGSCFSMILPQHRGPNLLKG
jgi:signal transduction histidine kinase/predicted transglutaminase-like cysteine proteinase